MSMNQIIIKAFFFYSVKLNMNNIFREKRETKNSFSEKHETH